MKKFLMILTVLVLSFPVFGRLKIISQVPDNHSQTLWQNTIILGDFDIESIYDKTERERRDEFVARKRGYKFTVQLTPTGAPNPRLLRINIPEGGRIRMLDTYILCIGGELTKNSELEWTVEPFTDETLTHTTITFKNDPTTN